jgi:ribonuclease E
MESEVETEETEGLADEQPATGEAGGEGDAQRRGKRRRRRRGRGSGGSEAREGEQQPREDTELVQAAMAEPGEAGVTDDGFAEDEESDEQPGFAGAEQGQNGDRRPRRRGRRGGRRRRGGGREDGREDGLAGSISDELTPPPAHEAANAVADFDGGSEPAPSIAQHAEPAPAYQPYQPEVVEPPQPAAAPAPVAEEAAAEEKAARRRSTVREKVSFTSSPSPDAAPAMPATIEHPATAPAAEEPDPDGDQPRKAGWWSRRFGGG